MPDDDEISHLMEGGLDDPRALPPALAAEVVSAMIEAASTSADPGHLLLDIDGPRALPSALADKVLAALQVVAISQPGTARSHRDRRMGWLGRAAVLLIVAGMLAALTRSVPSAVDVAAPPSHRPTLGPLLPPPDSTTTTSTITPAPPSRPVVALSESDPAYARLDTFSSCQELLSWVKPRAEWVTDEYGLRLDDGFTRGWSVAATAPTGQPQPQPDAPALAAGTHSVTNVQEVGVDEPDMLKVAGGALALLTTEALQMIDTSGGGAVLASTTPMRTTDLLPMSLLADGANLVVLSGRVFYEPRATQLRLLDVSQPAKPIERDSRTVPGVLVDARVVDGVAHLVTGWTPGPFSFVMPANPTDRAEVDRDRAQNRRVIRESTVEQWIPPGVPCDRIAHPRDLSGFSQTLIWSFPIGHPSAMTVRGLLASPSIMYASADHLVVGTERWEYQQVGQGVQTGLKSVRTNLHLFALEDGGSRYLASGSVPGFVRSPYALSDKDGYLRVASTDAVPGVAATASSTVTVLADDGHGLLQVVGSIGGLGAGQSIQGVRFVGDVGYVVTYKERDPLYTIDVSDPTHPRLRGALDVSGFSSYLQQLSGGRVLGVGVEATDDGQVTGGAVSMYDVSNLDAPRLEQRLVESGTRFAAAEDPHALLLWGPTAQLVLPASTGFAPSCADGAAAYQPPVYGFYVYVRGANGFVRQGTLKHAGHGTCSEEGIAYRAAMVNGVLYTVSSSGVMASDPTTLAERGWAALPR